MTAVRKSAFSLVEMLVVLAIIALLMGMLITVMQFAKRSAGITATQAIMAKVDTGLRLFKADIGGFPYQQSYADVGAGEAWTNRLAYHLGREMTALEVTAVRADMDWASKQYAYDCTNTADPLDPFGKVQPATLSANAFRKAWIIESPYSVHHINFAGWDADDYRLSLAALLNQMGQERARMAVAVGHAKVCGVKIPLKSIDLSTTRLVPDGDLQSGGSPGWAADYLRGEVEKRFIDNETIKDHFGRPLIYIGQILPGVRGTTASPINRTIFPFNSAYYGLAPTGRTILSKSDAGNGQPTPVDAQYFPDVSNLMHSDMRHYAAPKLELDVELWSAGPDGRFTWYRDGHDATSGTTTRYNHDNISLLPYNKQLVGQ